MRTKRPMQRLAIVYPKAIGDFVFILPALHTIRRRFPEAHITLVIKQKQAPLAEPQKGVLCDEVIVLGRGMSWWKVRKRLAAAKVDTIIDMAGNDQAGIVLSGRRERRLRPHRSDCKGMCALYTPFAQAMPRLPVGLHRVDGLLRFAEQVNAGEPVVSFGLKLPDQAIEESENVIAAHDLRSGSVIALNLGASRDSKRWPVEHFMTLTEDLVASGHRVALLGARRFKPDDDYDQRAVQQFHAKGLVDGERCVDLVNGSDLAPELHLQRDTQFLRYSGIPRVTVGCDTGALHIAGSVGEDACNRTISLFGPTNWGRYAPYDPSKTYPDNPTGKWNRVLFAEVDCLPTGTTEACDCYRKGCAHKNCMHQLAPRKVLEAVTEMAGAT